MWKPESATLVKEEWKPESAVLVEPEPSALGQPIKKIQNALQDQPFAILGERKDEFARDVKGRKWTDEELMAARQIMETSPEQFTRDDQLALWRAEARTHPWRVLPGQIKTIITKGVSMPFGWGEWLAPGLQRELSEELSAIPGYGGPAGEAIAEGIDTFLKWKYIYPLLFKTVGFVGKIPYAQKAVEGLKRITGLSKLANVAPRAERLVSTSLAAFPKGAIVGGGVTAIEAYNNGLSWEKAKPLIIRDALIMGGVATAFNVAGFIDTQMYVNRLRKGMIAATNQKYASMEKEVKQMPSGPRKTHASRGLAALHRTDLKTIDRIVSEVEGQLIGVKAGKLYQTGQKEFDSPRIAAQKFMRGEELLRVPKGIEALEKELIPKQRDILSGQVIQGRGPISVKEVAKAIKAAPRGAKIMPVSTFGFDVKSQQFKEFALTKDGSEMIAASDPDIAAKIAVKETPSRNDLKELGITGWNAAERTQLAALFRDALADQERMAYNQRLIEQAQENVARIQRGAEKAAEPTLAVEKPAEPVRLPQEAEITRPDEAVEEKKAAKPLPVKEVTAEKVQEPIVPAKKPKKKGLKEKPTPPTEAITEAKPTKEPWEMTADEWVENRLQFWQDLLKKEPSDVSRVLTVDRIKKREPYTMMNLQNEREDIIKKAIDEGKPVPREVLEEYKSEKWAQEALAKPAPAVPPKPTEAITEAKEPLPDVEEVIKLTPKSPTLKKVIADISRQTDIAFRQNDLDTMRDIVQLTWELPKTPEADALRRRVQILDGEMLARARKRQAKPAPAVEKAEEIEYEEETITEPVTNLEMEQRKTEKPVSEAKATGELDPTNYEDAIEITRLHADWVAYNKDRPVLGGIYSTEWDNKRGEPVIDSVEYTPEQIDTAYRTVQKPVPSPMPDTEFFAMPGKEDQIQAIAEKMQKIKPVSRKTKKKGRKLTKPAGLPKAKTSQADHIKAVYQVTAKETTRYAINGVKVEGDIIIATDGRRMLWAKGKWGKDGLYLDAASLKNGLLGKVTKEKEGIRFPKWRDIVPDVSGEKPILVGEGIYDGLESVWRHVRQAQSMTTEESSGITIIANKDGSLGFAAASPEIGHVEINIYPGGKILGGVNPQFLLDAISFHAIRGNDNFEFYFSNPDRPMLTKSLDGKTSTLTMPINIEEVPSEAIKKAIAEFLPVEEKPKSKGLKEKSAIEEEAEPTEEGGGVDWSTAVRQGLEKSHKERRTVRIEQKKERSRRAGAYENTVKWLMEQGVSPKEALDKATAMLKGPLTEYQLYEGLDKFLPQETIGNAYKDIATTDRLRPYERLSTKNAFEKLETGAVLTPGDVRLIKKWRPELAKIAEKRVPLTVRIFGNIEQALGLLKFGAAFDIQTRRQARWLRGRHPKLFTQAVGRNLGAYMSRKYADRLAKEVEYDPRHEDAIAAGVKFLGRKGERPEQFISYWGEKVPLKIGKAYAASMRGFIDSLNWLQQQLWNYKVEQWEKQGVTLTEEMLHDLADFNNTFLGLAQAKTNFGRATRRVLAPVMWSPTLTWSRVRTPSMILTNKTMRTETAVSLASYIGSGIMFMLAASFLARALRKKDPIEWDPRSTDFGKIRIGDTRIDVYGDGGPYIRAVVQLCYPGHAKKKNQAGRLRRRPRLETLKQFVRNKRAPFFDFIGKVWSGRNYYGGPAWEIPDWAKIKEEGGLKQLVARAGEKITEPKIGRISYLIAREISQKFTPFFVQSTVEASWHDGWPLGLAAGADEFFSGQALSYKPSTYAKAQMVQDISATAKYDKLWDDLSPSQQRLLRKSVPEINELEELLAREKLPLEEIDLREQNKVAERIRRSLPEDIRKKLAPMGYRIIPGLSRRLGDFWLNDERYAKYEKLAGLHIEARLRRLFALKGWEKVDISRQEKLVKKEISKAKAQARAKIVGSKSKL